jgi:hypothetical protein
MTQPFPFHPYTGLQAIGWCKRGPIWPVMGGAPGDDDPADPANPPVADPPVDPAPAPELGDAGKKALTEERTARKAAEKLAADQAARLREFEDRDKTEAEKLAAKAEASDKIAAKATARAVRAEVKAAAEGFADPADAAAFLDLSKYADAEGEIDSEAIAADVATLLAAKPHLAKGDGRRSPAPDPSQGPRGGGPDVDSRIAEARKAGDFKLVIALENQKLTKTT